jgi:glutamate synthase (NADPH/NADH) large chain
VVILGPTGRNFAAGMSGGIAYVWDPYASFNRRCNRETVDLDRMESEQDNQELCALIEAHEQYTGSAIARALLDNWVISSTQFVKVMPKDYKRVLESKIQKKKQLPKREIEQSVA